MTSSADRIPLEELINAAMKDGYRSIRLFRSAASVTRDESSFTVDQLQEDAPPADKLRDVLEQALRVGRWSFLQRGAAPALPCSTNQQKDELDDLLG